MICCFKMRLKLVLNIYLILLFVSTIQTKQVQTENGLIEGQTQVLNGTEVHSFIGIPFAEPPLGQLRFKKPVAKTSQFDGIYKATEIKAQCVSPFNTSDNMSEDCLYLNVWTVGSVTDNKPVMFWIYGGSFFMGSAYKMVDGYYIFNGTQLALRDVVVVTANYRLGVFGYLFGDNEEAPGNMGHWDQYQALVWIKRNINAFGGDPNDITLFGVSAGSISISAHIISPVSRGLFTKAIMQSGSIGLDDMAKSTEQALTFSRNFAKNSLYFPLGACLDDQTWIQCLKAKTSAELNTAQMLSFQDNFQSIYPFKYVFGDQFLPKSGKKSLKDSDFKSDVQLLIGHSLMEGVSFARDTDQMIGMDGRYNPTVLTLATKDQIYEDIKMFIPTNSLSNETMDRIATAYTEHFPNQTNSNVSKGLIQSGAHAFGDVAITCQTILFGSKLVESPAFRGMVYQYRLTYANSKSISYGSLWAEAEHTDEQPLVFGRPLNELSNNWTVDDKRISDVFLNIWTEFAKTGKPTLPDGNHWPEYKLKGDGTVNISYVDLNPILPNSHEIQINRYRGKDGFTPSVINNCLEFWSDILVDDRNAPNHSLSFHNRNPLIIIILIICLLKISIF